MMSTPHIGADQVVAELRRRLRPRGTSKRVAHELGVSTGSISQIASGYRLPSERVAKGLGFRKLVVWVRDE